MAKILFHHIPKTAGTSLIEHAQALFGDRVCPGRYDFQVSEAQILDERLVFYHGHFSREFVLAFRRLVPDALIFTFVRHPFNRALSQYHNWTDQDRVRREFSAVASASGDSGQLRELRDKFEAEVFGMTVEAFLRSQDPDILQATDNVQSRFMTAVEHAPGHARFNTASINAATFYDFIGVQELFTPCLRILEAKCGLPPGSLGGAVRSNVSDYAKTSGRYRVTDAEMSLLERRNLYDLALFHVAYALLVTQYPGWMPPGAHDLDALVNLPDLVASPSRVATLRAKAG